MDFEAPTTNGVERRGIDEPGLYRVAAGWPPEPLFEGAGARHARVRRAVSLGEGVLERIPGQHFALDEKLPEPPRGGLHAPNIGVSTSSL